MRLQVQIFSGNAALVDDTEGETARILRELADDVEHGVTGGILRDINGNRVGDWQLQDDA